MLLERDLSIHDNDTQRVIEERAEEEADRCAPVWRDWLVNFVDGEDIAVFVSTALEYWDRGEHAKSYEWMARRVQHLRQDYAQYRVAEAHRTGEWQEVAADLAADDAAARADAAYDAARDTTMYERMVMDKP